MPSTDLSTLQVFIHLTPTTPLLLAPVYRGRKRWSASPTSLTGWVPQPVPAATTSQPGSKVTCARDNTVSFVPPCVVGKSAFHLHQHSMAQRFSQSKCFLSWSHPQILNPLPWTLRPFFSIKFWCSERIYDPSDRCHHGKAKICSSQLWKSHLCERRC